MTPLDSSLVVWLNRPYFDLGPFNGGALHVYDIELSYSNLVSNAAEPYVLSVYIPTTFRRTLLHHTGLTQYQVENPAQLPLELRTERWSRLCDYLEHYDELEPMTRLNAITVLKSLCLHRTVLEYVPQMSEAEIASDPFLAALALRRAMSNLMIHLEGGKEYNRGEFEVIAHNAPFGSAIRIGASLQCVVQDARMKDLKGAAAWRARASEEIQKAKPYFDDFNYGLLMSLFYRAGGLVTLLTGDKAKLIEDMSQSEAYARELMGHCTESRHEILAEENRNTVIESRTKEAMWLGDMDLAEERARQLAQFDSLNSKYHIELAATLVKRQKIEEAAMSYRTAARLGPPMMEVAWFMAGQCYESLGDMETACDCYLASLQIDPEAICAVERLTTLAKRMGRPELAMWSRVRLAQLQERQQSMAAARV